MAAILSVIADAARGLNACVYTASARTVKALGVGLDPVLFDRAALVYVDAVKGTPEAVGNSIEEIQERGYFDTGVDIGGGIYIPLRIVVQD